MAEVSAGLMMYRWCGGGVEVLLVHPGGPYWVKKDAGAWTIPKGRVEEGEGLLAAARREFLEETGVRTPEGGERGGDGVGAVGGLFDGEGTSKEDGGRTPPSPIAPTPCIAPGVPTRLRSGFVGTGPYIPLGWIEQRGGKVVHAWGFEGACEPCAIVSNTMRMEWPPRSERWIEVPEVDRAGWFGVGEAKEKVNAAQGEFVERLVRVLGEEKEAAG